MRILFLCTGNSCRSQMAEGWAKALLGHQHEFVSTGIVSHGINPTAVKVMAEVGVDISQQASTSLDDLAHQGDSLLFDIVFTVCGHAHETCPIFEGTAQKIHVGFDDPPTLAKNCATEDDALAIYRRVRDEIRQFIISHPALNSMTS